MRRALALAAVLATAAPALAQVPPAEIGQRYIPAPWWLREPVIASTGMVRVELPANRARFRARFGAVERTAADATTAAAKRARELDQTLRALGADRVQLTTSFTTRPLYEQYRQKDGAMVDNERADKIDRYEVTAILSITVRDTALLERAYRSVVAARPTSIDAIDFTLEADNATKTWLATEAVRDAARRAKEGADASGGHRGAAKIVDPSGSVCRSQVLAGWPSYLSGTQAVTVERPAGFDQAEARQMRFVAPAPAPPPPSIDTTRMVEVTLQPPVVVLTEAACVIYALLP